MDHASWLRDRILRALVIPAAATSGSCAASDTVVEQPSAKKAQDTQRNTLCATWLQGRDFTWCTDSTAAKNLAAKTTVESLGCPSVLDQAKVSKALTTAKFERGNPQTTDVILLHEKSQMASSDCRKNVCCYVWANRGQGHSRRPIVPGRPLTNDEVFSSADVVPTDTWTGSRLLADQGLELSAEARNTVAAHWLGCALAEHASIASFSRATIELMAIGAPVELVRGTSEGASDEIDHAVRCFAIARAYGALPSSPGPLPALKPRPASLDDVAMYTFLEGCVCETIASLEAVVLASTVASPLLQRNMHAIASDEVRHAELAWKTLAWCHEQSPASVSRSIQSVIPTIRDKSQRLSLQPAGLEAHGVLGAERLQRVARRAWSEVIEPALESLGIT